MSLNSLTTKAPIPFEPDLGDEVADLLPQIDAKIAALLRGVAGCSPYLRGLIVAEAEWLSSVLAVGGEHVLTGIMDAVDHTSVDTLGRGLRRAKRRLALYVALADTGGMWTLEQVTAALSDFADFAVQSALSALIKAELDRGRLPGCGPDDVATACGMVVLAMGKMGAGELNYSSDIDLIVLFDETRHKDADFETLRQRFIRITRRMMRMLSDVTADGYVFRTDLRLRPDPSVTPVCLSMGAAERYYESLGRTWERAAFIKARPCAGDFKAGAAFLDGLAPFVWRKHLDYAAIQDAHDMRLRIREHKGLRGPISLPGHNIKLGRGGIREIEFFTQTRQLIAGGRDPDLRQHGTVAGLMALADKRWISPDVATALCQAYRNHREVEHRIQMLADAQTHDIPASREQITRLARFCGYGTTAEFQTETIARLDLVHNLTESFFAPDDAGADHRVDLTPAMQEIIGKWHGLPALRTSRARQIFKRLEPVILSHVCQTANPTKTLTQFDGFLAGLPAGVQLFALFEANPQLIDLLVDICGSAPGLARYLSRNAQVFDGVIGGSFFEPLPGVRDLAAALDHIMGGLDDYEQQLNAARRWMKEQHFRIGVQHLKSMINSEQADAHYTDLASAVLSALLPPVCQQFARRHGPLPGRGAMIMGMGSLGSGTLTATSDLDLIVIYDAGGQEDSIGPRPLAVSTYYARLTQALVTALTSPMSEGRLYEVDMRLRPSGRKGPVATPISGYRSYQETEAWTWEHLALTRARPVAGNPQLCQEVETFRQSVIARPRDPENTLADVMDMRAKLADAADRDRVANPWETKLGAGRMLDIELLAQTAALMAGSPERSVAGQIDLGVGLGWYGARQARFLIGFYDQLKRVQHVGRLLVEGPLVPDRLGQGGIDLLLAETGKSDLETLAAALASGCRKAADLIDDCLG